MGQRHADQRRTRRCSQPEPAGWPREKSNVIGGWLRWLTFALGHITSRSMIKGILFALVFAIVGSALFGLIAPLVFPTGTNFRELGEAIFPECALVCGAVGFVFGWRRSKKLRK